MAPHSSTLAWQIPWTGEPGRLQPMRSLRVGHDCATSLSLFTFLHWRKKWQPTRVLAWRIPGAAEPVGLPSMGSHRVGHDWSNLAAAATVSLASASQMSVAYLPVNSFIEIQFSYHKIDVFEAYRLTDFSYIQSFLTINMIILETSHSYLPTPTLPISQPLVYFLFMDLPVLNISYKQNQTIGGFLSLMPYTWHKHVHPRGNTSTSLMSE